MAGPETLPRLLTIDQLAEHLGTSHRHLRRLIAERRIPYVKGRPAHPIRSSRDSRLAGQPLQPGYRPSSRTRAPVAAGPYDQARRRRPATRSASFPWVPLAEEVR